MNATYQVTLHTAADRLHALAAHAELFSRLRFGRNLQFDLAIQRGYLEFAAE